MQCLRKGNEVRHFIQRMNNGCTSHILFHVLYKDINNGQNYKNQCAGSPSLCTCWSAVMSPNNPFQFSLKIQSLQSTTQFFSSSTFILVPSVQCHILQILYSFLLYITCMNNELAKYLCTFYNWISSHPNNTVILRLKQYICQIRVEPHEK